MKEDMADKIYKCIENCDVNQMMVNITTVMDAAIGKMQNAAWLADNMEILPDGNRKVSVIVPGTLTSNEKEYIVLRFTEYGFVSTEIRNSEENGERSGLVRLTFVIRNPDKRNSENAKLN